MKKGIYTQLDPVLFGSGTVAAAGDKAKEIGITKAMVVSDEGVEKAGHVETLTGALKEAGLEYIVWAKAEKDCPDQTVAEAAAIAREEKVDGIIGIGGGSVLDTAKAIAAVTANDDQVLKDIALYIMGVKTYVNAPLPVLEIPTTSGTGSESTFVAVVTSTDLDCKIGLPVPPQYAIVDPQLTCTVPQYITAFTGMDCLAHATESLSEAKNTAHSDLLAYEAIRLVHEYLPKAVADGNDLDAREHLAFASNIAGISFNESGTHVGHSCAHAIGHHYHLDHGVCCADVTPAVIRFTARDYPEKIKRYGEIFGVEYSGEETSEEIGRKTAEAVSAFGKSVGVKTFREEGLTKEELLKLAEEIDADHLAHCYGGELTRSDIEEILAGSYED